MYISLAEISGVAESCADLSCYFGAVCTDRTGGALCECAAAPCPDSDLNMLVSLINMNYAYMNLSFPLFLRIIKLSSWGYP